MATLGTILTLAFEAKKSLDTKMSRARIARECNTDPNAIGEYMRDMRLPSVESLAKVCAALDIKHYPETNEVEYDGMRAGGLLPDGSAPHRVVSGQPILSEFELEMIGKIDNADDLKAIFAKVLKNVKNRRDLANRPRAIVNPDNGD